MERGQGYDDALEVTSGCFFSTATEALAANTETYAANAATGATTAQPANYDARQRRNQARECSLTANAMISVRVFMKFTKLSVL